MQVIMELQQPAPEQHHAAYYPYDKDVDPYILSRLERCETLWNIVADVVENAIQQYPSHALKKPKIIAFMMLLIRSAAEDVDRGDINNVLNLSYVERIYESNDPETSCKVPFDINQITPRNIDDIIDDDRVPYADPDFCRNAIKIIVHGHIGSGFFATYDVHPMDDRHNDV